jgi:metallo-beta-lactamase class B
MPSCFLSRLVALGLAGAALATAANEAAVKAHLDAAEQAAGTDLKAWLRLCRPASAARPTVTDDSLAKLIATPGPAAAAAFDNLFYLGSGWAWTRPRSRCFW